MADGSMLQIIVFALLLGISINKVGKSGEKIIEFFDEDLENLQDKIAKKHGYKVIRHSHQLFVKPIIK